jgi:hypothetical protein
MHRFVCLGHFLLLLALMSRAAHGTELGVELDRFTVDGKPAFLLGCSMLVGSHHI